MTSKEKSDKDLKSIPEIQRGSGFRSWYIQMTGYLNGISETPDGAPWAPMPEPYVDNPAFNAVRNREAADKQAEEIKEWHRIERKCHQALLCSVTGDPVAKAFLHRNIAVENLPLGQIPRTRTLFESINTEFGAASEYGLEHWTSLLTSLKLRRNQPISDFVGILEDTIAELISQGGTYSNAQSKTKLAQALKNGEEHCNLLGVVVSMSNMTYAEHIEKLRFFDISPEGKERLQQGRIRGIRDQVSMLSIEDGAKCNVCQSTRHASDSCWIAHPELKKKWEDRNKNKAKKPWTKNHGNRKFVAKSAPNPIGNKKPYTFPKPSVSMLADNDILNDDRIFVDTCAAFELLILKDKADFSKLRKVDRDIGCAALGATLNVEAVGSIGNEEEVLYCPNSRHNICSQGRLHQWNLGYRCDPGQMPALTMNGEVILIGRLDSKMPSFAKEDIFRLMHVSHVNNKLSISAVHVKSPENLLKLWHHRLAHLEIPRLVNQERRMLTTGMNLPRDAMMPKHVIAADCPCKACKLSRVRRHSFKGNLSIYKSVIKPAMLIVADWHPFTNCPSRSGYFGVWNFTDVASRKPFSYCSESKGNFLACAQKFKREELDPLNLKWIGFHSDSDSAALSTESTKWLLDIGVRQTSSPTDTPEMNSVAELTNRELYQMTLSMLIHSNMPVTFWEDAYQVASMTKGYIAVKNSLGYTTPDEVWYGTPPNIKHLRTWGCRAWVQEPRVEARKDFHPRGAEGKLIGYSDLPKGWIFWIPEIKEVAVSVNATFDEDIPERAKEYFLELEPCLVPLEIIEGSLSTYKYLALKYFIDPDDNLLYQVTRVKCLKDRTIVGYVRRVMEGHTPREIRQPIHARDIEQMVNRTDQSSQNIQAVLREMVSEEHQEQRRRFSCEDP
jgi:hypothetical protein